MLVSWLLRERNDKEDAGSRVGVLAREEGCEDIAEGLRELISSRWTDGVR